MEIGTQGTGKKKFFQDILGRWLPSSTGVFLLSTVRGARKEQFTN
ncbi:hypothetical protein THTE_3352 [Thermogutta terrifontis]|uniref:Uncharacterized protein n=1 Tax=Thermogutta terrifontis TaxID=1331910 RepID=A0A286RJ17_9BACT|nr:hypothetical protein THTE_3352 [Thermogutta terrifontis]